MLLPAPVSQTPRPADGHWMMNTWNKKPEWLHLIGKIETQIWPLQAAMDLRNFLPIFTSQTLLKQTLVKRYYIEDGNLADKWKI